MESSTSKDYIALYIPEIVIGSGFWINVRNFERTFYTTTCIDAVRFVKKNEFKNINGFDELLDFGPDDWDFNRRIQKRGNVGLIKAVIFHNEKKFNVKQYLLKKWGYSFSLNKYIEKWGRSDPIIQKQIGVGYRFFGVFFEKGKWRRLVSYPLYTSCMYFLRILVGLFFLISYHLFQEPALISQVNSTYR